jgi:hypothetical protein
MAKVARVEAFAPEEIATIHVMNPVVLRCFLMGTDPIHPTCFAYIATKNYVCLHWVIDNHEKHKTHEKYGSIKFQ